MKTLNEKKAELLDEHIDFLYLLIRTHKDRAPVSEYQYDLIKKYQAAIGESKQPDPLAVDVFKGRCGTNIIDAAYFLAMHNPDRSKTVMARKEMRLSDMPRLSILKTRIGVGKKSFTYYEDVMRAHNMEHKLK